MRCHRLLVVNLEVVPLHPALMILLEIMVIGQSLAKVMFVLPRSILHLISISAKLLLPRRFMALLEVASLFVAIPVSLIWQAILFILKATDLPLSVRVSLRLRRSEVFVVLVLGVHPLIAFVVHQIKWKFKVL